MICSLTIFSVGSFWIIFRYFLKFSVKSCSLMNTFVFTCTLSVFFLFLVSSVAASRASRDLFH